MLLRGGWSGGGKLWSTVTDDLERTHLVVAPEMPLIGSADGLPTFGAYAAWLAELLTALGIERATIVGNSLGATIAWRFAGEHPERCSSLVLVSGYQPPVYSSMLRWLAAKSPMRVMARSNLLRQHYGPGVREIRLPRSREGAGRDRPGARHFHARRRRPRPRCPAGRRSPCPPPKGSVLLIWGEADRLPVLDEARRAEDEAIAGEVEAGDDPGSGPPAADRAPGRIPPGAAWVPEALIRKRPPSHAFGILSRIARSSVPIFIAWLHRDIPVRSPELPISQRFQCFVNRIAKKKPFRRWKWRQS